MRRIVACKLSWRLRGVRRVLSGRRGMAGDSCQILPCDRARPQHECLPAADRDDRRFKPHGAVAPIKDQRHLLAKAFCHMRRAGRADPARRVGAGRGKGAAGFA